MAPILFFLGFVAVPVTAFQSETEAEAPAGLAQTMRVVYTREDFQFRELGVPPVLVYDHRFFRRFEPFSVGDILKRIPGISGSAEAGEFVLPQMRGIGPRYTQILVNGKPLPGGDSDRTFQVDRIPAALVARIEIVRAPNAAMAGEGIGGTINIVLKQTRHGGGEALLGGMVFDEDSALRGRVAAGWSQQKGPWSFGFDASLFDRHNPKTQNTHMVEDEVPLRKREVNTLNAVDAALNTRFGLDLPGEARFDARLTLFNNVKKEHETARFFEQEELVAHSFDEGDGTRRNLSLALAYARPHAAAGLLHLDLSHHIVDLDERLDVGVFDEGMPEFQELLLDHSRASETLLSAAISIGRFTGHLMRTGVDLRRTLRESRRAHFLFEDGETEAPAAGGIFDMQETRLDAYLMDDLALSGGRVLNLGIRMAFTALNFQDNRLDRDQVEVYPSMHYLHPLGDHDRLRFSLTRSVTRPDFQQLQPFLQRDVPREGRNTRGNPQLRDEWATGVDFGWEHQWHAWQGMIGLNLFYRHIHDRVEILQVDDTDFRFENTGDGRVFGFELDLGLPLTGLGLPNVSLFANAALQRSRMKDPHSGEDRRFNLQSDRVFNLGWLQAFPRTGLSYGLNWLHQSDSQEILLTERAHISHGDNLEVLLEARLSPAWSLRFTGRNLTDASRDEHLEEYEGLWTEGERVLTGDERERSGRVFMLTLRGRFGP